MWKQIYKNMEKDQANYTKPIKYNILFGNIINYLVFEQLQLLGKYNEMGCTLIQLLAKQFGFPSVQKMLQTSKG